MHIRGVTGLDLIKLVQRLLEVKEVYIVQTHCSLVGSAHIASFEDEASVLNHILKLFTSNKQESLEGIYRMDLSKHPVQVEELVPSLGDLQLKERLNL